MLEWTEISSNNDQLARRILEEMYPNATFENKVREKKAIQDIQWMLLFISEGFKANSVSIVQNLIQWFRTLFKGLHIEESHATLLLDITKKVLKEEVNNQKFIAFLESIKLDKQVHPTRPLDVLYEEEQENYLQYLLQSNRNGAQHLIHRLVDQGISIEDIYIHIFQATMREVGYLWQIGEINVGREHYCTAVTQYIMSTLYSKIFQETPSDKRLIACTVGSELHELGIRMVADIFELNGWDTTYLGPNLPKEEIVSLAKEFKPHVIALSITMPYHFTILKETIDAIKQEQELQHVKIIVGGYPFTMHDDLERYLGADAIAKDALEGIKIANELIQ